MKLPELLHKLFAGDDLSYEEARFCADSFLTQSVDLSQGGCLLTALSEKGITFNELQGFRDSIWEKRCQVDLSEYRAIDVCGTGGDRKNTINISTMAAFVIAGAGYQVIKHGNSSSSSSCGSSDLLGALRIEFSTNTEFLRESIEQAGICYLHAPLFYPVLKEVAPFRRSLSIPTIFNILGPLLNPAAPSLQLTGVASPSVFVLYREYFLQTKTEFAIVHSRDGYDEVSLTEDFLMSTRMESKEYAVEELGFSKIPAEDLRGAETLVQRVEEALSLLRGNAKKSVENVVLANAALAIQLFEKDMSFHSCFEKAQESLQSGRAMHSLRKLQAVSQ